MKKRSRRSRKKYPALDKQYNLHIRGEYIDYDYLHKLDPEQLKWLNQFTEEELNANLKDAKFNKKQKDRNRVYQNNNRRNHCIYGKAKAAGRMSEVILDYNDYDKSVNEEDEMIKRLDPKKRKKK